MPQKTFLIGLGAQKAGTSWLWDYIDAASGTDMGPVKEYHVLDALFLPECREFRRRIVSPGPKGMLRRARRAICATCPRAGPDRSGRNGCATGCRPRSTPMRRSSCAVCGPRVFI